MSIEGLQRTALGCEICVKSRQGGGGGMLIPFFRSAAEVSMRGGAVADSVDIGLFEFAIIQTDN